MIWDFMDGGSWRGGRVLAGVAAFVLVVGMTMACAGARVWAQETPEALSKLEAMSFQEASKQAGAGLREREIRDEALRAGACEGSASETEALSRRFKGEAVWLDQIFNFAPLLIGGNVLPPVITEVRSAAREFSRDKMETAWVIYRIRADARVVTSPPSWRDYLLRHAAPCPPPPRALLPKNDTEHKAWKAGVDEGWKQGVKAADLVAKADLNRLARDITGMLRFSELKGQDLVALPVVAGSPPRVVVQGRDMEVGQRVFRITRDSWFRAPSTWHAVVRDRYFGGVDGSDSATEGAGGRKASPAVGAVKGGGR